MTLTIRFLVLFLILLLGLQETVLADKITANKRGLFVFGGQMRSGTILDSVIPFSGQQEDNYLVGFAYDHNLSHLGLGFNAGLEVGLADRFGDGQSIELWWGIGFWHEGIRAGNLNLRLGVVMGFSSVWDNIGIEAQREIKDNGDASLLFYLGPEFILAHDKFPHMEFVMRLHHRSGYNGLIGNMGEGTNANTFGIRWKF